MLKCDSESFYGECLCHVNECLTLVWFNNCDWYCAMLALSIVLNPEIVGCALHITSECHSVGSMSIEQLLCAAEVFRTGLRVVKVK